MIRLTHKNCDGDTLQFSSLEKVTLGPITLLNLLSVLTNTVMGAQLSHYSPRTAGRWLKLINLLQQPIIPNVSKEVFEWKIVICIENGKPIALAFKVSDEECLVGFDIKSHPLTLASLPCIIHPSLKTVRLYQVLIALVNGFHKVK